ncbi:hypothetical protein [Flavobacterium sp.]|uniref:hypothetical protein n=1 Tax=Flavobacterium sp. TaxID=239 RepID=UPI002FD982F7
MKKWFLIIIVVTATFANAQTVKIGIDIPVKNVFEKAILHFNDGTSVEGIGKLKAVFTSKEEVIVFKIEEKDKDETWTVKDVTGITIIKEGEIVHYEYLKVSKYSFSELYEVVTEGSVKLYRKRSKYYATDMDRAGHTDIPSNKAIEKTTYYLKRENEEYPTKVKDNYIKSVADYMKDCDVMVEKIKNHEYNLSELKDLVDYYNANCGD